MKQNFIQFYQNLLFHERVKLKREICSICEIAEPTFVRKKSKTDVNFFKKLEREAITKHINKEYNKEFEATEFFDFKEV